MRWKRFGVATTYAEGDHPPAALWHPELDGVDEVVPAGVAKFLRTFKELTEPPIPTQTRHILDHKGRRLKLTKETEESSTRGRFLRRQHYLNRGSKTLDRGDKH